MAVLLMVLLMELLPAVLLAQDSVMPLKGNTQPGGYAVVLQPQLDPLVINRMHSWMIHLQDTAGNPLTGARVSLRGGMPLHYHGLPTQPLAVEVAEGEYLLEGMRFHMHGLWLLEITIDYRGQTDNVSLELHL
jgi:hypothetical protein